MKIHIFVLLISLSTLFSAILYAQETPCQTDADCPTGMICDSEWWICLDPLIVECSSGQSGRCFYIFPTYEHPECPFDCVWSGDPEHYCSRLLIILLNFCQPGVW